ncbi:hypothetical protein BXZ70DRAFT_509668 [Cristinia sonorae]|uniref:Uncharacterized protein n=1 Tax=Cristinia sonorae TaxID=1940300 RepID=A0A8K0UWE1_9AGAR|nr:hypothetical protein BXZ70DRAFT_509668 [Cristinia sonorae]
MFTLNRQAVNGGLWWPFLPLLGCQTECPSLTLSDPSIYTGNEDYATVIPTHAVLRLLPCSAESVTVRIDEIHMPQERWLVLGGFHPYHSSVSEVGVRCLRIHCPRPG